MSTWISSSITGYKIASGIGSWGSPAATFSSPGSNDLELITRLQATIVAGSATAKATRMNVKTSISYSVAEFNANQALSPPYPNPPSWLIGHRLYIADAGGWPAGFVPSPAQILTGGSKGQNSVRVYRPLGGDETYLLNPSGADVAINRTFTGPFPGDLSANTKYWMMVMPVRATYSEGVNDVVRIFRPLVAGANATGRAISFWTNRRPLAPVITSPASGSVYNPGEDIPLDLDFNDPDQVGSTRSPDATGANGVHIQYAEQATLDNPNPEWRDLTLYQNNQQQSSWTIYGSTVVQNMAGSLIYGPLLIRAGGNPVLSSSAVRGHLPQGKWQIRVRVFDPGVPWNYLSSGVRPVNGVPTAYTASNYYSSLTSPWSTPIPFTIPISVPPPQPISPVNRVAISEGEDVTLVWKYRSTADPISPQTERVVQLRLAGEDDWTTIASGAGAAAEYEVGDDLPVGLYQWRVQATDSTPETSDFSQIAEFWIVPAPASGGERPDPDASIDGGTLGCGTHTVDIYRRGGKTRVAELTGISYLDYNRVRDDISTSKIVVRDWSVDCGDLLKKLQTWAYEVVIYRNNGYSKDRVWEGPITLLTYEVDSVTIDAKDVMAYPYRRIIKQAMNDAQLGATVTDRAMRVIQNVMAADDPNVLPYLNPIFNDDDTKTYRSTPAYSRTAFEEIDDMAANAGLDYTAVGRSILLWSTKHRIGTLPEFRDADFGSPPIVSEYGMSMANFYSVSDGNGIHGEASRLGADEVDEVYGLVEMLSSTWASDTQAEQGTYTQQGLQTVIDSFSDSAERSINDRYPPPVIVRVPDNTTLNPDTVISIQQLVPGVVIPLRSQSTLRTVIGNQKLDSVTVIEQNDSEVITVTMSPFSSDDGAIAEGEQT
jgi:hypothetical protein